MGYRRQARIRIPKGFLQPHMPMVVLLLHRAGKALGWRPLGIAALSVADYHANLSPVSKQQRELAWPSLNTRLAYRQKIQTRPLFA